MLNTNSRIAKLLTHYHPNFDFVSPSYLLDELTSHQKRLTRLLDITPEELSELIHLMTRQISFISEEQIKQSNWLTAEALTSHVDSDDIAFVALTLELSGLLWTGDKKLTKGLANQKKINVLSTDQLDELVNK